MEKSEDASGTVESGQGRQQHRTCLVFAALKPFHGNHQTDGNMFLKRERRNKVNNEKKERLAMNSTHIELHANPVDEHLEAWRPHKEEGRDAGRTELVPGPA